MSIFSVIGILVLLAGVFLVGFGMRSTQTLTDKVVQGVTGRYTQKTLWFLIGGGTLILMGGLILIVGQS